jgi:3-hydroxybutyryl-CoA dehydrogenase
VSPELIGYLFSVSQRLIFEDFLFNIYPLFRMRYLIPETLSFITDGSPLTTHCHLLAKRFLCAKLGGMLTVAVLADDVLKQEFLSHIDESKVNIIWADSVRSFTIIDADAYFDLEFNFDPERIEKYRMLSSKPVILNAVSHTTEELGDNYIRLNAWPTMLKRNIAEIAIGSANNQQYIIEVFAKLNWECRFVPDVPGMIVPRIISMIINEAYFTFGDGVSSKEEIDIAMKLGTNYPYGPFEWSRLIGLERVYDLLQVLSKQDKRYEIAPALANEAHSS